MITTSQSAQIKTCSFQHMTSDVGGAVFINNIIFNVELEFCYFADCNSTSSRGTVARNSSEPSGGACHFDVTSIVISSVYTTSCFSNYFGHAIYCSLPSTGQSNTSCFSNSLSGKEAHAYSAIIVFDDGYSVIRDINISHPLHVNQVGAIHIGHRPVAGNSLKYSNIVFGDNNYRSAAIGFSLGVDSNNEAEYVHIQNALGTQNSAIFTFWQGYHKLNHFFLINCSGNLEYLIDSPKSIIFMNSYIDEFSCNHFICINSKSSHNH